MSQHPLKYESRVFLVSQEISPCDTKDAPRQEQSCHAEERRKIRAAVTTGGICAGYFRPLERTEYENSKRFEGAAA